MAKQKPGKTKQIMHEHSITTRDGMKRFSAALKGAKKALKRNLTEKELERIIVLYKELLELDTRNIENIPLNTAMGLGAVLARHMETEEKLLLVSLASPAYIQDASGKHVNITKGTRKKAYQAIPEIAAKAVTIGNICTLQVLLSDIDSEVEGKSSDEVETLFRANLEGLQEHFAGASRLSKLISGVEIDAMKKEVATNPNLVASIKSLQERSTVLTAHKITKEAIKERAITYAALGKILEEKMPMIVIMDIQSRIYPYEQPFYDILRDIPIPLLRPTKF